MSCVRMCSDMRCHIYIYTALYNVLWTEVFANSLFNLKAGINAYFLFVCKAHL